MKWLEAELLGVARRSEQDGTNDSPLERRMSETLFENWLTNPELASVRDELQLAFLPSGERQAWQQFWEKMRSQLKSIRTANVRFLIEHYDQDGDGRASFEEAGETGRSGRGRSFLFNRYDINRDRYIDEADLPQEGGDADG